MKTITDSLDFNKLLRKDSGISSGVQLPSEMFQIAIFLSRKVIDELNFNSDKIKVKFLQNKDKKLEQLYNDCEILFEDQYFVFPLYSQEIFTSPQEAEKYVPLFIKSLIQKEMLPENVIDENKMLDENIAKATVVPLVVTFLEKEFNEFKN